MNQRFVCRIWSPRKTHTKTKQKVVLNANTQINTKKMLKTFSSVTFFLCVHLWSFNIFSKDSQIKRTRKDFCNKKCSNFQLKGLYLVKSTFKAFKSMILLIPHEIQPIISILIHLRISKSFLSTDPQKQVSSPIMS